MTSQTTTQSFLNAFAQVPNRATAVRVFFDALAPHQDRIAATERRADDIFRFRTPDRPFIQYDVTDATAGLEQKPEQWARHRRHHRHGSARRRGNRARVWGFGGGGAGVMNRGMGVPPMITDKRITNYELRITLQHTPVPWASRP